MSRPPPRRPGEFSVRPGQQTRGTGDEPSRRRIAVEILVFALLCLVVGAAIVAVQVARKGDQVLHFDPHNRSKRLDDGR